MRCPECDHAQKYSQHGMTCNKCHYQYVFNPKQDRLSDYELRQIIRRISDNDFYCFTRNQLAIEISRYISDESMATKITVGFIVSLLIIIVMLAPISWWGLVLFIAAIVLIFLYKIIKKAVAYRLRIPQQFAFSEALKLVERYHAKHSLTRLATGKAFAGLEQLGEVDVFYAPEAILLVQRDDLVDMLVRNRFAQNNKVAVISQSGYPQYVFKTCEKFLEQNPKLPIYIVHDAAQEDFNWLTQLQQDGYWQHFKTRFKDLGWTKANIIQQSVRLPWLSNDRIVFSRSHQRHLKKGHRVPVDFPPPAPMLTMLSAAVINGVLLAAAAESVEGWSIIFEYSEEYG